MIRLPAAIAGVFVPSFKGIIDKGEFDFYFKFFCCFAGRYHVRPLVSYGQVKARHFGYFSKVFLNMNKSLLQYQHVNNIPSSCQLRQYWSALTP